MNVLIADKFVPSGIQELRAAGCDVVFEPALQGDALREAVARIDPNVLIVRSTRVTAAMLEATVSLSVVVRAGAGVNTIDLAAASRRSIRVANCPGINAVAVAELTFALILALDRRVVEGTNDLRNGVWNKKQYAQARGLKDRTLGLVGFGKIGQAVARRAQAFGMHVVVWSRSLTAERAQSSGVTRCEGPSQVASKCDILSIHLASVPETNRIIDANVLNQLAPGSYVINTARAEVMDYEALANVMTQRDLRVALDVYPDEPSGGEGSFTNSILQSGGFVYGTHHIGASTQQAQSAIAAETVAIVKEFLHTGRVKHCVNLSAKSPAKYVIMVRHRNRPGVLAHTLNVISHAGVNVEEMENLICEGALSACAQIKLDGPLSDEALTRIKTGNEHVFAVTHTPLLV